jgi:23S rRNA pseudouridine1911/1915/1917 synthase
VNKYVVNEVDAQQRLDVYLTEKMHELSRSFIKKLCDMDKIKVNGIVVPAKHKVKAGDKITVDYDLNQLVNIPKIDIPIIYEDKDCVVIDKPAGLLTHSKGNFNPEPTVATWLEPKTKGMDSNRAGIVHRLDRATSGVMIGAKTPEALSALQKQFSLRRVKKTYIAVIEGELQPLAAVIDMPIERHPAKPKIFRVGENGRQAITEYQTIRSNNDLSEIRLMPKTGRTHQLRVHLKQLDHPIVGDVLYGGKPADRLYLHAKSLELTLPNRERKIFESPLPNNFETIMDL